MNSLPLSAVKHKIELGQPLPFEIRDAHRRLLLARGDTVDSLEHLDALLEQGAVVSPNSSKRQPRSAAPARPPTGPALWNACTRGIASLLLAPPTDGSFDAALDAAVQPLLALIERDPDLTIFQVLRESERGSPHYGVTHSVHAGVAGHLVARRLGWNAHDARRTLKAALTMNLSILELQKHLATRHLPLTSTQRNAIAAHPLASVRLLEDHGITDTLWLTAVAQHHEVPGGSGYPHRLDTVDELATLLRHVDIYTARLSPRAMRESQAADLALREMFKSDAPEPVVAAIAREFGMYPPGCHVALASGEIGVVVKRGDNLSTPVVAVMFDSRGEPLREPLRRDTALPAHAIVKVVTARRLLLTTHRRRQITAPT